MNKTNIAVVVAIMALVVAVAGYFKVSETRFTAGAAGGLLAENYLPYVMYNDGYASAKEITTSGLLESTGTFTVGANGSAFAELKGTTCNMLNADASIAASSTAYVYCTGITGLASGDMVVAQLSTTTSNTRFGGWVIQSAKASSTAGAVDMMLYNGTGVAGIPSDTAVGSSTNIWYADF